MIKKLLCLITLCLFLSQGVMAALDPRVKALGTMAVYGTAGGALLGTATLAFGSSGRSVAKGASIGLYAGILFGSYIVISHAYKQHRIKNPRQQDKDYYPDDTQSPYEEGGGGGLFDLASSVRGRQPGKSWQANIELAQYQQESDRRNDFTDSRSRNDIELIIPVIHLRF
jgi:hypothetical protein